MLIEFRVENYRSLRDEQVLTMEAGRVGDPADPRPREVPGHGKKLLPVAVLYGANASGKTNVLRALAAMQFAVSASHMAVPFELAGWREAFAWGSKKSAPTLFEVVLIDKGVRYQYGFTASDERFLEEWLYVWPRGKKQVWYERDQQKFKFGENLRGESKRIEEFTRPEALFLSVAVQHQREQLQPVYSWLAKIDDINVSGHRDLVGLGLKNVITIPNWPQHIAQIEASSLTRLMDFTRNRISGKRFRALLRDADIGVVDVRNDAQNVRGQATGSGTFEVPQFFLKHTSQSGDAWLPLEQESHGTQTLFRIAVPILEALEKGSTLLIDELESSLHPALAQQIVRHFNDPKTNPLNAQLICTTHDTNLLGTTLGEPALRRDQIWFTEKDAEGATVLYPLTDYKPRKAENLERGYLQGRYGAIPFLGDFSMAAE